MRNILIPVFLIIIVVTLTSSVFVISEGERGIVTRFGRLLEEESNGKMKSRIYEPGLHFKIPMFDKLRILDARIRTMDGQADRFVTSEQKDVIIDSYVKWRIEDFGKYYEATNITPAEVLLERKVRDALNAEIGSRTIQKIVSGPKKQSQIDEMNDELTKSANETGEQGDDAILASEDEELIPESSRKALEIEGERDKIMAQVLKDIHASAKKDIGIHVVDFRMKKINLPDEVSESIYARMRAERETVARKHRSQGRREAEKIRAKADFEVTEVLAKADKVAREKRGAADAKAAAIYSATYDKDPDFYSFLRSLDAYQKSFSEKSDIMVLDPNSDFFKYMNSTTGESKK